MIEKELSQRQTPETFKAGFETYLSPFTFRYGTDSMRKIWSQENFWRKGREVWIAVAKTQQDAGLTSQEQVDDLIQHKNELLVKRIFELEKEKGHDVAAAISEYSEVASIGGRILHQGMTSEDVLSNAEIIQIHESFDFIKSKLVGVLDAFAEQIKKNENLVCMGWTHFQAAEPTTMGYRFAKYAQDLLVDLKTLDFIKSLLKGKGIKGAVGTSASFAELLQDTEMTIEEQERKIMKELGIEAVTISDQTYPRKFLFLTEFVLANIGQSLHRFALDLQILQSSPIDEVSEPRRKGKVGSSAMPHKENPINSENIDSVTEELPGELFSSWITSAFTTLERTLRDSAGKRSWLPESFLIVDEALTRAEKVVRGLVVHENSIRTNLERFAPFCVTEIILNKLTKAGMDRKEAHEILLGYSEKALEAKRSGLPNPMKELLLGDERITTLLGNVSIEQAFDQILKHVGNAPQKCEDFLRNELYPELEEKHNN